jgi:Mg2+-importing ATPase
VDGRDVRCVEIAPGELVPGDIVVLSAGDMVPADLRLLSAKDLFVGQGAMTGEALPVEKFVTPPGTAAGSPLELANLAFMGTPRCSAARPPGGDRHRRGTYFGTLAAAWPRSSGAHRLPGRREQGELAADPLHGGDDAAGLRDQRLHQGRLAGGLPVRLSVAIGLTPEMLPMVVTSTLAKGAVLLSRRKVIVKRLDAIQNFGAMDVLCTDKTGTLTQDHIVLQRHIDIDGQDSLEVLEYAWLNSHYQTGLKNLLDVAVLARGELAGRPGQRLPQGGRSLRLPAPPHVGWWPSRDERHLLICKGAVEEVLAACTHVRRGEAVEPLTPRCWPASTRRRRHERRWPARRGGGGRTCRRARPPTASPTKPA